MFIKKCKAFEEHSSLQIIIAKSTSLQITSSEFPHLINLYIYDKYQNKNK